MNNPFLDSDKVNAIMDRHLMGEKTRKSIIGEIWCVPGETSPTIVKVNPIVLQKLGYTSRQLRGMHITDLMTRDETIKIHIDKYFDKAFSEGKNIIMRHHGQGFELKSINGEAHHVAIAAIFAEEDPTIYGNRMISKEVQKGDIFCCLTIIFIEDFKGVLEESREE